MCFAAIGNTRNDIDFILSEDGDPDTDTARTGSEAQDENPISAGPEDPDKEHTSLLQ